MRLWRTLLFAVTMALGAGLVGCAEEVEDVNRVQPHYITKSLFEGDWYFRQTLVDRPPQFAAGFTGIEGELRKVRWEIREEQLIAYQAHESVPGLNIRDTREGSDYKGQPVAIFHIDEHFDIIRDFDRTSGQQRNVLVEDSTLKPWYEREFMRVDWTENKVVDPVNLTNWFSNQAAGSKNTIWVRENDAFNPDHFQITDDFLFMTTTHRIGDGGYNCAVNYGYGTAGSAGNCGLVDVKVRSAFVKIDPEEFAQFNPKSYLDRELINTEAESYEDTNDNGRYDGPEYFVDDNNNGRHDSGEKFTDRDGDDAWSGGEKFTDSNANGIWDKARNVRYTTVSVGDDKDRLVDVACTPEVMEELAPDVTLADCKPLSWNQFGRFGYFRTQRVGYDQRVGAGHDENRIYLANHHQMWKKTRDADGQLIDQTARELRPIIYYLNPNFPEDLKATAVKVGKDWNATLMKAAMAATGRDAETIGAQLKADYDAGSNHGVFLESEDGVLFGAEALFQVRDNNCSNAGITAYLDRNPSMQDIADEASGGSLLPGNIEAVCSGLTYHSRQRSMDEIFIWQQMGDPRVSFMWWVNEDQPSGPLGYGPSSVDIENGEIRSGNAYVYGAAIDRYATSAADIVAFINGNYDLNELIDGDTYRGWIEGRNSVADNPAAISPEFQAEISARLGSDTMRGYRRFKTPKGVDKAAMQRHMNDRLQRPHSSDPLTVAATGAVNTGRARLEQLKRDPEFRAKMVSPEMLQLLAPLYQWQPGDEVSDEMFDMAIDLTVDPAAVQKREQQRQAWYADQNIFLAENLDDSVIGQALDLVDFSVDEVRQILRREIFEGVMLHEVGHTLGLRHNFQASFDALNYQDEFWDIRERVAPEDWNEARLPEYRYASIMDYGARFNSDTKGLGKYDFAAIQFVYGNHVDVFADSVPVPGRLDMEIEYNDYSKIPEMLGGDLNNIKNRKAVPIESRVKAMREGVLKNADLLVSGADASAYWTDTVVPFQYCADSFNGDLKCRTWDEGANHTEAVQSAIQNYWNYYFFNAYRRQRNPSSFTQSFFRRQGRLSEYLTYPWKFYFFYDAYPVDTRTDLLQASMLGMNFINQVMGTPEPGRHCRTNAGYYPARYLSTQYVQENCTSLLGAGYVEIPKGVGRDLYLSFNDDYVYGIDYIGTYYDKVSLFPNLVSNFTRFFRLTDQTDDRQYTIGFYHAFQNETVDLLTDMMWSAVDPFSIGAASSYNFIMKDGEVQPQLLADPARADGAVEAVDDSLRIFSRIPYQVFFNAAALTAIYNTNTKDSRTDFGEYLAINVAGSGQDRELGEDAVVETFVHPLTGEIYRAAQTADGRSLSHSLLVGANRFMTDEFEPKEAALEAAVETARLNPSDANEAAVNTAQSELDSVEFDLQNYVELMDDLRMLRSWVDYAK